MRTAILLTLVFLLVISFVQAQDDENSTLPLSTLTAAMNVTSSTNGQEYLIFVGLPWGYASSTQAYPVLYLLDAIYSFGTVTDHVRLAALGGELPAMIVVGIGYPANLRLGTPDEGRALTESIQLRERDFIGADAAAFLQFLTEELIPLIDATYRTDPKDRTIFGGSHGGAFALHALQNKAETFGRYIIYAPSQFCQSCEIENTSESTVRISFQVGELDELLPVTQRAFSALEEADYEWLDVSMFTLENTTHLTGRSAAIGRALKAVFCENAVGRCNVLPVGSQTLE